MHINQKAPNQNRSKFYCPGFSNVPVWFGTVGIGTVLHPNSPMCSTSKVSDKQNLRVSPSYILQCAIYPICPVFNARTGKLTAQASNAIKRIFNIADHNFNDVIEKVKII